MKNLNQTIYESKMVLTEVFKVPLSDFSEYAKNINAEKLYTKLEKKCLCAKLSRSLRYSMFDYLCNRGDNLTLEQRNLIINGILSFENLLKFT